MAKGSNNLSGRRSHGAKPYDSNNSFVKKVATKVTDLMPQRSWISKWFNNSENNGEMLNDSENAEYEGFAEEVQEAPAAKRPRIRMDVVHPPGTFNIQLRNKSSLNKVDGSKEQFINYDETNEDFLEPLAAGPSGACRLVSSTPAIQSDARGVSSQRSNLNSVIPSTQDNGVTNGADDNSESSESTSGCSSLIPQNNRQEAPSNTSFASSFANKKRFIDDKMNYTNHLQSPRSLFLDTSTRDSLSSRRPSFNSSIMSNTLERSPSLSSPFYSGNVTFGGANAAGLYKRSRSLFNSNSEYKLKVPRRTNVQVKPTNTVDIDSSGISQTAKRILEALEHFSSPILDAKKIPIKNTTNLMNATGRKRTREEQNCASPKVGLRHMTRELTVPTVPDLLKIRRRQRLQDTTLAARQIVSAQTGPLLTTPSEYRLRTAADDDPKFRGKLRAKSKRNTLDDETLEPVNLPTIPLPISTLPRFEIALPEYTKSADRSTDKENSFKFASPIRVTDTTKSLKSINDFTFSNPLNAVEEAAKGSSYDLSTAETVILDSDESILSNTSAPNFMWSGSTAPKLKEKAKPKPKVNEPTVLGVASELKSGSVNDFLSELRKKAKEGEHERNSTPENKEKSSESTIDVEVLNSLQNHNESWECSECLIRNDSTTHCTSCKSSKPGLKAKEPPRVFGANTIQLKPIENDCFGSQFKLSTDQWECSACMVRNKQSEEKCVSCTTPRPVAKLTNSGHDSDLLKKFKPAGDSWECPGCMVRNNGNIMTCPCCNAAKPSSKAGPKKEASKENTLKFNNKSIEGFKPAQSTWECPCCMVRNAETATICPCCKAVKPGTSNASLKKPEENTQGSLQGFGDKFKKPIGAWNCDSCLISNKSEATECVACTTAKPGTQKSISSSGSSLQFSFGVPPKDSGFKFGIDKADVKSTESAGGFTFGSEAAFTNVEQFSFGIPKTAKSIEAAKPAEFTFGQKSTENTAGFQLNKSSDMVASAEKESNKTEKPKFTFGIPKSDEKKPESSDKIEKTEKVEKFSFGIPSAPAATIQATTASTPGFKFGSPKSKRPADDEPQAKKTAFGGAPTSIQTVSSSTTASPFSSTVTTSQTISSPPSFSFIPNTTVPANRASPATTTTVATSLPAFSNSTFSFSDQSKSSQPATLPSFGVPSAGGPTFSFGGKKPAETTVATEKKPPPAFPSATSTTTFGSSATASPFGTSEANAPPAFGAGEKKTSLFGAQENKLPAFGDAETKTPAFGATDKSTPVFGSGSKAPLFPAATPSFGASTTASPFGNSTPLFGNNASSGFGSPQTSNAFPASKPNDGDNLAPSTNLFSFGSSQPSSGGFNFAGGNSAPTAIAQKPPVFAFGANSSTTQAASTFGGNTFSTTTQATPAQPSFSFNSPKPEAPSAFRQSASASTPLFGAAQPAQGQTPFSGAGASNAGFSFGAAAPAAPSGGFNFGGMPQQPAPAPTQPNSGFNFNAPNAMAPNAMSFNFTGGNAPQAFNATPQLQQSQPQRKIKTAKRRMTPR
ncbi:nuclear pore complex protein Nup153 [Belonocnema kinseyi]|uniref:nuclear pore complex protein Nup153 n=1 Tax=Belonocnema kinseyi TaxID=2817044 RepID=UPI00143E0999|nr:nuclear pore complex protein Nup153 [Belonocnema kinseyi]